VLVLRATAPHFLSFDSHSFAETLIQACALNTLKMPDRVGDFLVRDFVRGPYLEGV